MQPVLALAREALRGSPRGKEVDDLLGQLRQEAENVQADEVVASIFAPAEAEVRPAVTPPVNREDIETALARLAEVGGRVRAKRVKGQRRWGLQGLGGRTLYVTTDRETLERDKDVLPMTLGAEVLEQLVGRLALPSHVPLLLEAHEAGPYRCVEARWVSPEGVVTVESAKQLLELAQAWTGTPPPAALRLQAQAESRDAAQKRVEAMRRAAQAEEKASLGRQVEAAQRRLRRELGRTLRCFGEGDLNDILRRQVQREAGSDGRYHQALRLLGGYPEWRPEDISDADDYARSATEWEKKARVAGSEVDAAIGDPRWVAQVV
jgi:hypothetical protein